MSAQIAAQQADMSRHHSLQNNNNNRCKTTQRAFRARFARLVGKSASQQRGERIERAASDYCDKECGGGRDKHSVE